MTGIEVAVGFLIAWAIKKANRAGKRADAIVDDAIDLGLDRVHEVVVDKLGGDPVLAQLDAEAGRAGEISKRTTTRVQLALEEATEQDSEFAQRLEEVVEHAQRAGADSVVNYASQGGVAVSGDNSGTISTGDNAINIQHR